MNQHVYEYDVLDQRIKQTRAGVHPSTNFWTNSMAHGYDALGQLVDATGKEYLGSTNRSHELFGYGYDTAGNLKFGRTTPWCRTFTGERAE